MKDHLKLTTPHNNDTLNQMQETKKIEEIIGDIKRIKLGHLIEPKFEKAVIHTNNALESLEDVKVLVGEK